MKGENAEEKHSQTNIPESDIYAQAQLRIPSFKRDQTTHQWSKIKALVSISS